MHVFTTIYGSFPTKLTHDGMCALAVLRKVMPTRKLLFWRDERLWRIPLQSVILPDPPTTEFPAHGVNQLLKLKIELPLKIITPTWVKLSSTVNFLGEAIVSPLAKGGDDWGERLVADGD